MFDHLFTEDAFLVLKNSLRASAQRHEVIANNIANVNTPNFKKSRVSFENELKSALKTSGGSSLVCTSSKHMSGSVRSPASVMPKEMLVEKTAMSLNGNNVDVDEEMTELAKNTIYYNALVELMKSKINMLKTAVREGK
ncbi:MAG TPA: flagellar basal body rod protein FlgB [Thermoplasmata archaeon]|nr:flagellar basal body rod protein FlgB [Thermoplasmata archaeon]